MIEKLDALKLLDANPQSYKNFLNYIATDSDDYISAGALFQLLDKNIIDNHNEKRLSSCLHFSCVRRLSVQHYLVKGQFQSAEHAVTEEKKAKPFDHARHLQYSINNDTQNLLESEAAQFIEDGQPTHLIKAASYARECSGENGSLPWMIRATLLMLGHPKAIFNTLVLLGQLGKYSELETLSKKLIKWKIQTPVAMIFLAQVLLNKGALDEFNNVTRAIPIKQLDKIAKSTLYGLIAKAKEKEENYEEASNYYLRQNNPGMKDQKFQKDIFINKVHATETLQFKGETPPATNHFMMLGFPRSGTTLLENALASHPKIETFEEIPAFAFMRDNLLFHCNTSHPQMTGNKIIDSTTWRAAATSYYDHIHRLSNKKNAMIFIDKMPINSAFAGLLSRCFPDKRYIFSIRHPYDVVLSCYKQFFEDNPSMNHFNRFDDACLLYDLVMKRWFTYFSSDDPRVCYIKYDSLVTDFQQETTRVVEFLGLQWNDDIMDFAEKAKHRPSSTPSYSKVRQGLDIGVQTSWEKYRFLYDCNNKKLLDPWVRKFGYEGI